jgi:hypothetical protein
MLLIVAAVALSLQRRGGGCEALQGRNFRDQLELDFVKKRQGREIAGFKHDKSQMGVRAAEAD